MSLLLEYAAVSMPILFAVLLGLLEAGRRLGEALKTRNGENSQKGIGTMEAAVFGLLGLLLAFTFTGAASRFDTRRHLIVDETNAIGTAYLRLDLLEEKERDDLRAELRSYAGLRLSFKNKDSEAERASKAKLQQAAQDRIWTKAQAALLTAKRAYAGQMITTALNEMFDISTTRGTAQRTHIPVVILCLLIVLAGLSALLAGYAMAASSTRHWMHMLVFAAVLTFTLYVIIDLEYPRFGIIRVDSTDHVLEELLETMK
jgi:cation transport ATPase